MPDDHDQDKVTWPQVAREVVQVVTIFCVLLFVLRCCTGKWF